MLNCSSQMYYGICADATLQHRIFETIPHNVNTCFLRQGVVSPHAYVGIFELGAEPLYLASDAWVQEILAECTEAPTVPSSHTRHKRGHVGASRSSHATDR